MKQRLLGLIVLLTALAFGQWEPEARLTYDAAYSFWGDDRYNSARHVAVNGNVVHVVWSDARNVEQEVYYKRSTDGGTTWGPDTRLSGDTLRSDYPSIAVSGDIVHVVWDDHRHRTPTYYEAEIYYRRSSDGGVTWGTETRLTTNEDADEGPSIVASGNAVHVAWHYSLWPGGRVAYINSSDGGLTWGTVQTPNNRTIRDHVAVAVSGGDVHLAWVVQVSPSSYRLYYMRSNDGGTSWSAVSPLSSEPYYVYSYSVTAAGSAVDMVFMYDSTASTNSEMFHMRSTDGGATWGPKTNLAPGRSTVEDMNIEASGCTLHVVWRDWSASTLHSDVYYMRSNDGGATWGSIVPLCGSNNTGQWDPAVAFAGKTVHVVWADYRDGNAEIYYKRGYAANVACSRLLAPGGTTDYGTVVTPACSVYNWGLPADYSVRMKIGTGYDRTASVSGHASGTMRYVTFPDWTAAQGGVLAVSCSTELTGDLNSANDRSSGSVTVNLVDVGCSRVAMPGIVFDSGVTATPACTVYNYGTTTESYNVRMKIGALYDTTASVSSHAPGTSVEVSFPVWPAAQAGTLPVTCSTELASDMVRSNDRQTDVIYVVTDTTWTPEAPPPAGPKNKRFKDGGCLAYLSDEVDLGGTIFALKGNNTCEFMSYDVGTGIWSTLESIPRIGRSSKKKAVKKGAALIAAGRKVYATKGNGTYEFWEYSPGVGGLGSGVWLQKSDVPTGAKKLKEGVGLASVPGLVGEDIYLLKGSATFEFYRYLTEGVKDGDVWETLPSAPGGPSGKVYKSGSGIVYYPDDKDAGLGRIFVLKGSYNEFFAYDIATASWATRCSLPRSGRSGKKTKARDGAGLARFRQSIYALKGNNTLEFWIHNVPTDIWTQGRDIAAGPYGKGVKAGGSITCTEDGWIYVTKGNNTDEFYTHAPLGSDYYGPRPTPAAVCAVVVNTVNPALAVTPNPFSGAATISYSLARAGNVSLKLYDITGKLLRTLAGGYHPAGEYSSRLTAYGSRQELAAGVYLLKFETEGYRTTQKLIIE